MITEDLLSDLLSLDESFTGLNIEAAKSLQAVTVHQLYNSFSLLLMIVGDLTRENERQQSRTRSREEARSVDNGIQPLGLCAPSSLHPAS